VESVKITPVISTWLDFDSYYDGDFRGEEPCLMILRKWSLYPTVLNES